MLTSSATGTRFPPYRILDSTRGFLGRSPSPVWIRGGLASSFAVRCWSIPYLIERAGSASVDIKFDRIDRPRIRPLKMGDFLESISNDKLSVQSVGYLHDWPLVAISPDLVADLQPFPRDTIARWYRRDYGRFLQLFIGPAGTRTPLHFDRQETHNLFLQIHGRKRFTFCRPEDIPRSRYRAWRWAELDLENSDTHRIPAEHISSVTLEPGDVFYLPPRTPHQVTAETLGISVNLDWHDLRSVVRSLSGPARGMPLADWLRNVRTAIGICTRLPPSVVYPGVGSYLQ